MKLGRFFLLKPAEQKINKDTGALNYSSCAKKVSNYVHARKNLDIIFIKITNQKKIKNQLGIDSFYLFLRTISEKLWEISGTDRTEVFYLEVGAFAIVSLKDDKEEIELAAEKVASFFLGKQIINNLEITPEFKICVLNYPNDVFDVNSIINFGNSFHHIISKVNEVTYLSQEASSNEFAIKSNIDDIIKKAIAEKSFQMYYQPVYEIEKHSFTSAEALIRLEDEKFGYISPSVLIAAAERSGAIHAIGLYVFEEVCRFISECNFEELGLENIRINLSVSQCIETDIYEKFLKIMENYNVDFNKINFEITESAANFNPDISDKNLAQFSDLGVTFSLDNYGTGYSNIKRILELPFTTIKLGQSFAYLHNEQKMGIIVNKMLDIFKRADKKVLVEGVEDAETLNYFFDAGCDFIQGFYYSKPLPQGDFIKFLKENNC